MMNSLLLLSWTVTATTVGIIVAFIAGLTLVAKARKPEEVRASIKKEREAVEARNRAGANGWGPGA